jgi:hypothetical protein
MTIQDALNLLPAETKSQYLSQLLGSLALSRKRTEEQKKTETLDMCLLLEKEIFGLAHEKLREKMQ